MIRLDTYQRKLQAVLGGAVTTSQPTAIVCYTDIENENQKKFFIEAQTSTLNNATPVDILAAPDKAMVREVDSIHIRNNDTVAATVTVRVNDNGTNYELVEVTLQAGETLVYTDSEGWKVITVYGNSASIFGYIDFATNSFPAAQQRLLWNDTDGTLEIGLKGGNVALSVGLELVMLVKEASNGGIDVGKAYYFAGSDGTNKTVAKAVASNANQADNVLGIATESSTGGNKAFLCTFGLVRNINTNNLTEGAQVYLSDATPGELTDVRPLAPNHAVQLGYCIRKSATVGAIFVEINKGSHLEYLHDVKLTAPIGNNEVIIYDSALGYWKNSSLSVFGVSSFSAGTTGLTPNTATTGAVTLGGTLDADNGGTGQSSYTVGDILYASGTTALSKLSGVATGNALISGGVGAAPSWGKVGLTTHITGTLAVGNGGTGITSGTSGGIPYFSSSSTIASSAVLSANALVIGGGAGVSPSTTATGVGVLTALGTNIGTTGSFVVNGGALGTPLSGTLTNCVGLPVATGISGLGTGVADALSYTIGTFGSMLVRGGELGTPSSGTVTNLTGTASININGTVGATTPNTGAFTTLSASGVATFSAGSASAPAITTSGDTDNGIFFPAADTTAITTAGSERLRVDSSGKVTIGGASQISIGNIFPAFQVLGTEASSSSAEMRRYSNDTAAPQLRLTKSRGASVGSDVVAQADDNTGWVQAGAYDGSAYVSNARLIFQVDGAPSSGSMPGRILLATTPSGSTTPLERMRIDSSGNVGVGVTNPEFKLVVNQATTYNTTGLAASNNVFHFISEGACNGSLEAYGTGGIAITGRAAGGTSTSPSAIAANRLMMAIGARGYGTSQWSSAAVGLIAIHAAEAFTNTANGTYIAFSTTPTGSTTRSERMRIAADGAVTMPDVYADTVGGTNRDLYIDNTGLLGYVTSIRASKTNIADLTDVSWLYQLNPVSYQYRKKDEAGQYTDEPDGPVDFGLIAEDTEPVKTELCFYDEVDGQQELRGINYSKLIVPILKALQEQRDQIESLKAEVAALKGN